MPPLTARAKLRKLYPTIESLEKARKVFQGWGELADALGINRQAIYDYRSDMGISLPGAKKKDILAITPKEIDEGIRRLVGDNTANVVTKYKITDPEQFYENPCRNEGLELVGVERGQAFNQAWKDWHIDG